MTHNKRKYLLLVILGIFLVFAFSSIMAYTAQKMHNKEKKVQTGQELMEQMTTFTMENNGQEYYLPRGETFQLILPENPTTGYRWMVAQSTSPNIALIRQEYLPGQPGCPRVGGGGLRSMIFQAIEKGPAELVIHLRRPWEPEEKYVDSFTLGLDIK